MTANKCLQCYVSGRVQGVFFRAAAQEKARELGLTGYARNLEDGRVEVYACGTREQLDALKAWLHEGSHQADVSTVECESAAHKQFDDFRAG
jgi:acylphosphatase